MPAPTDSLSAPAVALVMPVFNEEAVLPELFVRLTALFDAHPGIRWRAILVDDGSRDRSAELVKARAAQDPRFQPVALSRNFGFQNALAAGLATAGDADCVVTMDADLQDPPELIPELVEAWRGGAEVVLAVRRSRKETGLRRLAFDLFHQLYHRVADIPVDSHTGTFGLLGRNAVAALNAMPENRRYFPGLRAWVGFTRTNVFYDRQERAGGTPQQTLRRLLRYGLDGVLSFSYLPLRLLAYSGVLIGFSGFALGLYYVVKRLVDIETAPTGFTTLTALLLFLGGIQLIGIGILGEYLGRIYDEVKRRPVYLVKPTPPKGTSSTSS